MKNNLSEKVLYLITIFLIVATALFSLIFSPKKGVLVFFFLFLLIYWRRKQLASFFQKIKNPKVSYVLYIMTGWLGAVFLELVLGLSPFHFKPIANYLVGLGFYLPYFAFWLALIKRHQFTFLEVFCLSGLGRIIFDFLITHKMLTAAAVTTSPLAAFLVVVTQALITLVLFGALTALPTLCLKSLGNKSHHKPLKQYLVGLTPHFLAGGVFVVWTIVLKVVFK